MLVEPQDKVSPNASSRLAERVGMRYLCVLALIPVLAYIFPIPIFHLGIFQGLQHSYWGDILEYGYHLADQDADVVIFGDSTAVFGDDPLLVGQDLKLKVINIPNSQGSLPVTGDEPLQRYLQRNKAPRLIVLQFSPWDLNSGNHPNGFMYEGEEELLRHASLAEVRRFSYRNPLELLYFPFRFYATRLGRRSLSAIHAPVVLGHAAYLGHESLPENCAFPSDFLGRNETEYAHMLATKYATAQTRTMVYIAPIPRCKHAAEIASLPYRSLSAAAPVILPANLFADDTAYAHVLPGAVPASTHLLALAIQRALAVD